MRRVAHVRPDTAENAENALDQERRLDQLFVGEVGQCVEMADIVAFELEAGAEGLADLGHDLLDEDIVIVHDAAPRAFDIRLLPGMLPFGHSRAGAGEIEDQRPHVERSELRLRGLGAFQPGVERHGRAAAGGDVDDGVGGLLDARQEFHEIRGERARRAVLRIACVEMQDRGPRLSRADRRLGDLVGRHWQVRRHARRVDRARRRTGDDDLAVLALIEHALPLHRHPGFRGMTKLQPCLAEIFDVQIFLEPVMRALAPQPRLLDAPKGRGCV